MAFSNLKPTGSRLLGGTSSLLPSPVARLWQSEFLAVGSMAVLSIYLRQRGSPESKPVGAAHASTGVEG